MKSNVKWILVSLFAICILTAFASVVFLFMMKVMKGDAYDLSLQAVRQSPAVVEAIGKPIEPSWYVLGNIHTSGPEWEAAIEYPVTGALSKASVYVHATKQSGKWSLDKLVVAPEGDAEGITLIGDE